MITAEGETQRGVANERTKEWKERKRGMKKERKEYRIYAQLDVCVCVDIGGRTWDCWKEGGFVMLYVFCFPLLQ